MKLIIYGAGKMAERYLKSINTENILFIVDRNEEKTGREILGKKIFYIDK